MEKINEKITGRHHQQSNSGWRLNQWDKWWAAHHLQIIREDEKASSGLIQEEKHRIISIPEDHKDNPLWRNNSQRHHCWEVPELERVCIHIWIQAKVDPNRNTPMHIIVTMMKTTDRDRILKEEISEKESYTKEWPSELQIYLRQPLGMKEVVIYSKKKNLNEMNASPARFPFRFK